MSNISGKFSGKHKLEPGGVDGRVDMLQGVAGGFAEGNQMLRTLMDAMPIGCYVLRPDHTVLYWNPAAERLLGFSAEEMQGRRCVDMPLGCSFTDSSRIGSHCPAIIAYATGKPRTLEMFMRRKDGRDVLLRNTLVPLKDEEGTVRELVSFFVPLTEENYDQGLVKAIYETATRDPLTCLPGRKFMEVCLDEAMEIYRRTEQPFAVLFADVNNFHDINNTYGHAVGDDLLRAFGIALRQYGRKADRFCRWGGDEFVGLLHLKQPDDIKGAAQRFLRIASDCETTENGQTISCRAAIGITVVRKDDTIHTIVARADHYMYLAKKRKEDQIVTDFDFD
ncbi:sensor domain-containing diguanylate cyclase [Mitsuokella sp. AF21-1AC]|uniref:GGDEF domain-containing protein n=1 Tax=Mitsuokella sp. AF21-1AC TaxID=2292235 RepID=UPI001313FFFE|nr:sensor domain-containing diguanylate cyclase [Mitsuokella sp. AF21-1AC]